MFSTPAVAVKRQISESLTNFKGLGLKPWGMYLLPILLNLLVLCPQIYAASISEPIAEAPALSAAPPPTPTQIPNGLKVAFIGDTGAGTGFLKVLKLIKAEKADLVVVLGDTDYGSTEAKWNEMIQKELGNEAALVVIGNHDRTESDPETIIRYGKERLAKNPQIKCEGEYAQKYSCSYRGVYFVFSSIGEGGGSKESHELYIKTQLNAAPKGAWRICAWHKNQRLMQTGGKGNEVGWKVYEECRLHGAIIATAHEHAYSRTLALKSMSDQTVVNPNPNEVRVTPGTSFAFVSGLGGDSTRRQKVFGNHWAKVYTATQGAKSGALFGTFNLNDADFYFKNIDGEIVDQFKVIKDY